ncbi:hypothetical protein [Macellibacteroides fermentans]|uniref:Uncharacterized protein n=1 Tax=Macellibacteroides fermentans TaxID=879969 RepID=A0A8E2D5F3_9PORP|nr:hypothetical protein [Macellibacteroides fermentans]NYI51156.1 hypothetical protein [Macellibacteroides fermentans]
MGKLFALPSTADYQNIGPYNKLFPDSYDWINPYNESQARASSEKTLANKGIWKTYLAYDRTRLPSIPAKPLIRSIAEWILRRIICT